MKRLLRLVFRNSIPVLLAFNVAAVEGQEGEVFTVTDYNADLNEMVKWANSMPSFGPATGEVSYLELPNRPNVMRKRIWFQGFPIVPIGHVGDLGYVVIGGILALLLFFVASREGQ